MSGPREKSLIVWASGMIEFIDGCGEPEGAIRICTATGEDAIEFLFEMTMEQAQLHEFYGPDGTCKVALKVPGLGLEGRPGADPVALLIDWDAALYDEIGPDPDFTWKLPRELVV